MGVFVMQEAGWLQQQSRACSRALKKPKLTFER
jgi:hypothetical protein